MSANRDIKFNENNLNVDKDERFLNKQQNKSIKEKEINHKSESGQIRGNTNPSQATKQQQSNVRLQTNNQRSTNNISLKSDKPIGTFTGANDSKTNVLPDSNSASSATAASATAAAAKIDSDLINVANENRVILNVGGIRHETYKVSKCRWF